MPRSPITESQDLQINQQTRAPEDAQETYSLQAKEESTPPEGVTKHPRAEGQSIHTDALHEALKMWDCVTITGLVSATQFNGKIGVIVKEGKERLGVSVPINGKARIISVREGNLQLLREDPVLTTADEEHHRVLVKWCNEATGRSDAEWDIVPYVVDNPRSAEKLLPERIQEALVALRKSKQRNHSEETAAEKTTAPEKGLSDQSQTPEIPCAQGAGVEVMELQSQGENVIEPPAAIAPSADEKSLTTDGEVDTPSIQEGIPTTEAGVEVTALQSRSERETEPPAASVPSSREKLPITAGEVSALSAQQDEQTVTDWLGGLTGRTEPVHLAVPFMLREPPPEACNVPERVKQALERLNGFPECTEAPDGLPPELPPECVLDSLDAGTEEGAPGRPPGPTRPESRPDPAAPEDRKGPDAETDSGHPGPPLQTGHDGPPLVVRIRAVGTLPGSRRSVPRDGFRPFSLAAHLTIAATAVAVASAVDAGQEQKADIPDEWSVDMTRLGNVVGTYEVPAFCRGLAAVTEGRRLLDLGESLLQGLPFVGPAIADAVYPGDDRDEEIAGMMDWMSELAETMQSGLAREAIRDAIIEDTVEALEDVNKRLAGAFSDLSQRIGDVVKNDQNLRDAIHQATDYTERVEEASRIRGEKLLGFISEERRVTNRQIEDLRKAVSSLSTRIAQLSMASDYDQSYERNRDYVLGFRTHYGHSVESAIFASFQSGYEPSDPRLSKETSFLALVEHHPTLLSIEYVEEGHPMSPVPVTPVFICNVTVKQFPSVAHRLHGDYSEDLHLPVFDCHEVAWLREPTAIGEGPADSVSGHIGLGLHEIWAAVNVPRNGTVYSAHQGCYPPDKGYKIYDIAALRQVCRDGQVCGLAPARVGQLAEEVLLWRCRDPPAPPTNMAGGFRVEFEVLEQSTSTSCADGFGYPVMKKPATEGDPLLQASCITPFFDPGRVVGGRGPIPGAVISDYTRSLFLSGGGRDNLARAVYGPLVNVTLREYYPPLGEPYLVVSDPPSLMSSSSSIIGFLEGAVALRGWFPSSVTSDGLTLSLGGPRAGGVRVEADRLLSHTFLHGREEWSNSASLQLHRLEAATNFSLEFVRRSQLSQVDVNRLEDDVDLLDFTPVEWDGAPLLPGVPLLMKALLRSREESAANLTAALGAIAELRASLAEPDQGCGFMDMPCYQRVIEEFLTAVFFFAMLALVVYACWRIGAFVYRHRGRKRMPPMRFSSGTEMTQI